MILASLLLMAAMLPGTEEGVQEIEEGLSPQELLEFGPIQDRELIKRQAIHEYRTKHTESEPVEVEEPDAEITVTLVPPGTYIKSAPLTVMVKVDPPEDVDRVDLLVRRPAEATFLRVPMTMTAPATYSVDLGSKFTNEAFMKIYAQAHPLHGNATALSGGPDEPFVMTSESPLSWTPALIAMGLFAGIPLGWKAFLLALQRRQPADDEWWAIPEESVQAAAEHTAAVAPRPVSEKTPEPSPEMGQLKALGLERNPYVLLRVQRGATQPEIEEAYHRLRKLHFYGQVHEPIQAIEQAYNTLRDPGARARVDLAFYGPTRVRAASRQGLPGHAVQNGGGKVR